MDKVESLLACCYCDLLDFSPKVSNIVIPLKSADSDTTSATSQEDLDIDILEQRVLESSGQIEVLRCEEERSVENYSQFTGVLDLVSKLMIARRGQQLSSNQDFVSTYDSSSSDVSNGEGSLFLSNSNDVSVTIEALASKIETVLLSQYAKKHGLSLRKTDARVNHDNFSHDDDSANTMELVDEDSVPSMPDSIQEVEKTTSIPKCSVISLRDVYYSLKHLFRDQAQCNTVVLQVGRFLNMTRFDMGIAPASRGYIAGLIRFRYPPEQPEQGTESTFTQAKSTESMEWSSGAHVAADGGLSIHAKWASQQDANKPVIELLSAKDYAPNSSLAGNESNSNDSSSQNTHTTEEHVEGHRVLSTPSSSPVSAGYPRYLLIIEKEGIFKHLVSIHFFDMIPCILVTGCGFPDISTRACVSRILQQYPHLIVFGLCDYNVYGMTLLMSYTYSNEKNMSNYEAKQVVLSNVVQSEQDSIFTNDMVGGQGGQGERAQSWSVMKWIGLRHSQVTELRDKLPAPYFERLSERDKKRIESLKRHELVANCDQLYEELEHMLQGNTLI